MHNRVGFALRKEKYPSVEVDRDGNIIIKVASDYFGHPSFDIVSVGDEDSVYVHHFQVDANSGEVNNKGRMCLGKLDTDWSDLETNPIQGIYRDIDLDDSREVRLEEEELPEVEDLE